MPGENANIQSSDIRKFSIDVDPSAIGLAPLMARIDGMLADKAQYKHLLKLPGEQAQMVLDVLHLLLTNLHLSPPRRRGITVAMQRLARQSGGLPRALKIRDVSWDKNVIASGGYGDVYRGCCGGQPVCMKALRMKDQSWKEYVKEGFVWSQLSHPNVLPFLGFCEVTGGLGFVSPWMENGNIMTYTSHFPDANRLLLLQDAAAGLEYLHSQEIVHGDLKGINVLVDTNGRAYLADFGLSSVSGFNILCWTSQSPVLSTGGSLRWRAPETLGCRFDNHGGHWLDSANGDRVPNTYQGDVYSWACLCYEVLTGNVPFFEIRWELHFLITIATEQHRRPQKPAPDSNVWNQRGLSPRLWEFMMECWNRDPPTRPCSSAIFQRIRSLTPSVDPRPFTNLNSLQVPRTRVDISLHDTPQLMERLVFSQMSRL